MATREEIRSDLAIPPGEYLAEVLEEIDMSQADLARRSGRPAQAINEIVRGTKALTPETAIQLEQVVGVPAHIWLGLEAEYRLALAREAEREQIGGETALLDAFPYEALVKMSCVARARKAEDKVRELRRFFHVATLQQIGSVPAYAAAFRVGGGTHVPSPYSLAAWLHCGRLLAADRVAALYDEGRLRALLPELRSLTLAPAETTPVTLRDRLADCGVAFVLFPHFPKTYAQGATFWIEPRRKAVLLLSIRGKWGDVFWFSLFHELGHLLLHGTDTFVEVEEIAGSRNAAEQEADDFARDTLLPPSGYAAFADRGDFSVRAIRAFADAAVVHPGVVVGRLQHEARLPRNRLNELRVRYVFEPSALVEA